jgi:hypothetical protein
MSDSYKQPSLELEAIEAKELSVYIHSITKSGGIVLRLMATTPNALSAHARIRALQQEGRLIPMLKRAIISRQINNITGL